MSPTRGQSGPDTFKASKEKSGDALSLSLSFSTSLKAAIAGILTFSLSLALFTLIKGTTRPPFFGWPEPAPISRVDDSSPTNISHIAFGIAGSTRTWRNRGLYSDLWWKPGATRGFVFLDGKPGGEIAGLFKIGHRISSDWRRFRHTGGSDSAVRIARIVVDLYRAGLPDVRWFVMGDDDTVFFPENVAAVLAGYDHQKMVYVGGNSESVEQDVMHAYGMAFGGGGFAISYPLAAALAEEMDGCLERYHYFYGSDQRVWACAAEFGVDLSRESGFHQIDIKGDPHGLLAAHPVAPIVSLHHLDYVSPLFRGKTQLESLAALMKAYDIDPSRTFQQCICYHRDHQWSISISWGYTVHLYPLILTPTDLKRPLLTFRTWRSQSDGPFTFNTRPTDPNPCRQPIIFYLDKVRKESGDQTVTIYRKSKAKLGEKCDGNYTRATTVEKIIVLAPKMDPREWKQRTRRRHCCDIMKENPTKKGKILNIRIRKCKNTERIYV